MGKEIHSVADLVRDERNANAGTRRGAELIEESLRRLGAGRSVLADKNGKLIAGNKTAAGAVEAGVTDVIVVRSDGSKLVVVQRTDLDLDKDKAARELAIMDNRSGEVSLHWDAYELTQSAEDFRIDLEVVGFSDAELSKLLDKALREAGEPEGVELEASFQVVVECADEEEQRQLYENMTREGRSCRLLTL